MKWSLKGGRLEKSEADADADAVSGGGNIQWDTDFGVGFLLDNGLVISGQSLYTEILLVPKQEMNLKEIKHKVGLFYNV